MHVFVAVQLRVVLHTALRSAHRVQLQGGECAVWQQLAEDNQTSCILLKIQPMSCTTIKIQPVASVQLPASKPQRFRVQHKQM